ncbi:MAG: type II toxin-antitoxin system VapB family antitoxin [Cytophagales bacterium]|nr:type II toxin-antitoxin system VapB family antitoxin [Cytophagales bacterium]
MRTTLDIPESLVTDAMEITGTKTKSQVIRKALEELILRQKRLKLLTFKGKVDLSIDLDSLRKR